MTITQSLYPNLSPPALSINSIWSSSNFHTFNPTSATWSAGVVTVAFINHNLATNDVVSFVSTDNLSPWNINNVTATVIDKDTFSIPLVANPGAFPNPAANYPTEFVAVTCKSYSKLTYRPSVVQVELLPVGTTVQVQSKIHPDATWVMIAELTSADGPSHVFFNPKMNFIRCARTLGSGQPTVYSQD